MRGGALLEAELAQMTVAAGKAPSPGAWRVLTAAAVKLGFESIAHSSWRGRFGDVLDEARSLVRRRP
jgi:hypothetical protein